MLHAFWDSWIHERDVLLARGTGHPTDGDATAYAAAYGLFIAAAVASMLGDQVQEKLTLGGDGGGFDLDCRGRRHAHRHPGDHRGAARRRGYRRPRRPRTGRRRARRPAGPLACRPVAPRRLLQHTRRAEPNVSTCRVEAEASRCRLADSGQGTLIRRPSHDRHPRPRQPH
jgi:hypothetical protein